MVRVGFGEVTVLMVTGGVMTGSGGVTDGREVVGAVALASLTLASFGRFDPFGQFRAMWPCVRQRKHRPSARYLARSSSVSFLNRSVIPVASTSMGTIPLFLAGFDCFCAWYCLLSRV